MSLDTGLFLTLNAALSVLPDAFWANVTLLGDALVTLALLNLLAFRYPQLLPAGLLAGLIATFTTRILKPLLSVDRPLAVLGEQVHVVGVDLHNFSFPSGHTAAAFTVAGVYYLVLQRKSLRAPLFALATLIGLSRMAVGAHWPLDVLSGATLGWASALSGWTLAKRWTWSASLLGKRVLAVVFLLFSLLLFKLNSGYPQSFWLQMAIAALATGAGLMALWQIRRNPPTT